MTARHYFLLFLAIFCFLWPVRPQEAKQEGSLTVKPSRIPEKEIPDGLISYINPEIMKQKAALFIFNKSLHPLGKMEFKDSTRTVKYLNTPMKMNRCTLIYIDSGLHRFHTMYQRNASEVMFQPGEIFAAVLTTHSSWPIPAVIAKKDKSGNEYGAVLLHYITGADAKALYDQLNKKDVIINQ